MCQFFSLLIGAVKNQPTDDSKWLEIAKIFDLLWEEYHDLYPNEKCPFEGGFEEDLKKLFKLNG